MNLYSLKFYITQQNIYGLFRPTLKSQFSIFSDYSTEIFALLACQLQAIAKIVETLTVKNPTMRDIEVSTASTPPPPTQSCFQLDLALKLKGINIEKGGGGNRGVATSLSVW